ncbi:ATP-binding cassette domain-containing protein [Limibacter armeniacum]|uniref:ATP-binding cassette domain-containing protein n=1 Tax=Limibacter armeniacum TaxID=466084 RepID=UPI002FE551D9
MSEEILKALTQLFAIISSQDEGITETERNFVINFFKQDLDQQTVKEYVALYDQFINEEEERAKKRKQRAAKKRKEQGDEVEVVNVAEDAVSVRNSVRTLSLCRKINKTLDQKQKVIVLVKLLELVASDRSFTPQRMDIINTVADVFNIPSQEYKLLEKFVSEGHSSRIDHEDILIFDDERPPEGSKIKFIDSGLLDGEIIFVRVKSVGLYFTKYTGKDAISLNGQNVSKDSVLLFSPGSVFKTPKGAPLYYSDLVSKYNSDVNRDNITFVVEDLEFRFPNGELGLRNINVAETSGGLIGIMGASGAGKTTLLNVMAGLETPSQGEVRINGYNIHTEKENIEGVIGYIAQDDLLIEELTVYQNLYYNAKLCFKDMPEAEMHEKVMDVLESLGLDRIADLVVGNVLNKKISGGQRKRLNIALELIREPAVMFVDEPTSGLSSRDSENVIDLLKELSLKGKLIFVVIHQPSSDIYKMFDKMWLLDTGGYPIFYGNPVEAITYFKSASRQVDSDRGQCGTCGNVNPEQLFNIIEAQVVDEYGEFTNKRKVQPTEWHQLYQDKYVESEIEEATEQPPKTLKIPSMFKQTAIFSTRDFLAKISNTQYMLINMLEAPLLALLLSWVIRYTQDGDEGYVFKHNENVPAYILICIIVALFMGMTVSAEEIIKDRKILRRESFLNLSRMSYLFSKVIILFALSGIQTLAFVLIGNFVLDIEGMNIVYWLVLFTVSCHANMIGLNISSGFNSAVTVYILIPILLIPQMILSGLIFDFSKLNNSISEHGKTPLLSDIMASRWGYEAITVEQFRGNIYEEKFFDLEMAVSQNNYKVAYWEPKLQELLMQAQMMGFDYNDSVAPLIQEKLEVLRSEVTRDAYFDEEVKAEAFKLMEVAPLPKENIKRLREIFSDAAQSYNDKMVAFLEKKDSVYMVLPEALPEGETIEGLQKQHHNEKLSDLLKSPGGIEMTAIVDNKIVQLVDPVFNIRTDVDGVLDYRSHFFAPKKHFFGMYFDTYWFNVVVVWLMSLVLFVTLYFDLMKKLVDFPSYIKGRLFK